MSKVCLVSDQPVLLSGFARVLERQGFEVAPFTMESLTSGGHLPPRPDVALLDITAGLTFDVLSHLNSRLPGCPLVLWSNTLPLDLVFRTLEFGVRGIVPRTAEPEVLVTSLRKVAGGEMQIGFTGTSQQTSVKKQASLTPREREIVARLRQGLRNKQIASEMNITEGTVKIYLFRLFHKLGVRNRFELASYSGLDLPRLAAKGFRMPEPAM